MNIESLIGKKLVWIGMDKESERTYLFFEGMQAIAVDDIASVEDGEEIAKNIVGAGYSQAASIMKLKEVLDAATPVNEPESFGSVQAQEFIAREDFKVGQPVYLSEPVAVETHGGTVMMADVVMPIKTSVDSISVTLGGSSGNSES